MVDLSIVLLTNPSGWWLTYPSEKYEVVSWDDDIPNILWKIKNVPNQMGPQIEELEY